MTYKIRPKCIEAFQWFPDNNRPRWFIDLVEAGKAQETMNHNVNRVTLYNRRGTYYGFQGDWVCKDEYGHVFIWSKKTFDERTEKV